MTERIPTEALVERARAQAESLHDAIDHGYPDTGDPNLLTALAKALEDTAAERDRAHETMRVLLPLLDDAAEVASDADYDDLSRKLADGYTAARERLENP